MVVERETEMLPVGLPVGVTVAVSVALGVCVGEGVGVFDGVGSTLGVMLPEAPELSDAVGDCGASRARCGRRALTRLRA